MKVIYKPEGAEPRSWDFKPERLMNVEAEAIERHTGMTFGEWQAAFRRMSMLALHGFLFAMLKRTSPTLKWDEVVFCLDDVDFEADDDEKRRARDELAARGDDLDEDERAALAELVEEVGPPEEPTPKD